MPNYSTEMTPPDYRNLVINPSGEESQLGVGYYASNGVASIVTGGENGVPAAISGSSVVQYLVGGSSSEDYFIAPVGPFEQVHRGGFKIPTSREISFRFSVSAEDACYVQVQISWCTESWSNDQIAADSTANAQVSFNALQETAGRSILHVGEPVDETGWVTFEEHLTAVSIPTGATHWRPLVTVFKTDPAVADASGPDSGFKLWVEDFFVSDSGASLAGIDFVWGDGVGMYWEGDSHHSTSTNQAVVEENPVEGDTEADAGTEDDPPVVEEPTPDGSEETEEPEAVPTPPTPLPEAPDANLDDPGVLPGTRPLSALAEDTLTRKAEYRHLCLDADVQLEDMLFNTVDDQGVVWLITDIEGWWTTPEPDVPDIARAWFDGSYETRGRYQSRSIAVTGTFVPRSKYDVPAARDRLLRALNLVHRGGWFMTHEKLYGDGPDAVVSKGAKVWMVGQPLITTTSASGKTEFSFQLRAPDSLKYAIKDRTPPGYQTLSMLSTSAANYPERSYPKSYPWKYPDSEFGATYGIVQNIGNAISWPILKLYGPTQGAVRIYNGDTDQTFRVKKKLYQGEILEIDCFTRQATLNGVGNKRFYLDVDVDWLMLQPGPNKIWFGEEVMSTERSKLDIQWRSAWIG